MKKIIGLLSLLFFMPCISNAATGDVLFNCKFDGAGSTPAQVWTGCGGSSSFGPLGLSSGSIVSGGHDGGKAISFYYPNSTTPKELYDPMYTPSFNKTELTYTYWEKFDKDPSTSWVWNVKSSRAFLGSGYMGGFVSAENHGEWMQTFWSPATLTTTSNVTHVKTDADQSGYCGAGSGSVYPCNNGRLSLSWSPGFGTTWHKIRIYLKAPSSSSATDGKNMVWIDDNLIYTLSNIPRYSTWGATLTNISFHPSDDFLSTGGFPFHHLYDDITVYEGFVPPSSTGTQTLASPTGLRITL